MPDGIDVSVPEYKCFGFNDLIDPVGPMSALCNLFFHHRDEADDGDGRRIKRLIRGQS